MRTPLVAVLSLTLGSFISSKAQVYLSTEVGFRYDQHFFKQDILQMTSTMHNSSFGINAGYKAEQYNFEIGFNTSSTYIPQYAMNVTWDTVIYQYNSINVGQQYNLSLRAGKDFSLTKDRVIVRPQIGLNINHYQVYAPKQAYGYSLYTIQDDPSNGNQVTATSEFTSTRPDITSNIHTYTLTTHYQSKLIGLGAETSLNILLKLNDYAQFNIKPSLFHHTSYNINSSMQHRIGGKVFESYQKNTTLSYGFLFGLVFNLEQKAECISCPGLD